MKLTKKWMGVLSLVVFTGLSMGVGCSSDDEENSSGGDGDGDAGGYADCDTLCEASVEAGCEEGVETGCAESCAFLQASCAEEVDAYFECAADATELSCAPGISLGLAGGCELLVLAVQGCVDSLGAGGGGAGGI